MPCWKPTLQSPSSPHAKLLQECHFQGPPGNLLWQSLVIFLVLTLTGSALTSSQGSSVCFSLFYLFFSSLLPYMPFWDLLKISRFMTWVLCISNSWLVCSKFSPSSFRWGSYHSLKSRTVHFSIQLYISATSVHLFLAF